MIPEFLFPVSILSDSEVLNPYLAAREELASRELSWKRQLNRWQGVGLLALALLAFSVGANVVLALRPAVMPFFVAVDAYGQARATSVAELAREPDRRMIAAELGRFIHGLRVVYPDPVAQRAMGVEAMSHATEEARRFLGEYFSDEKRNPLELARQQVRQVEVNSVLPLAGSDSWQVEWTETDVPLRGGTATVTPWRATVAIAVVPGDDERSILANPLGLYVTAIEWTATAAPRQVGLRGLAPAGSP